MATMSERYEAAMAEELTVTLTRKQWEAVITRLSTELHSTDEEWKKRQVYGLFSAMRPQIEQCFPTTYNHD